MTGYIPPLPRFALPEWADLATEPQGALCRFMWLYEPGVRGGAYNFRQALSAALAEQVAIAAAQDESLIAELRRKIEFLQQVQADAERGHEAHLAEKTPKLSTCAAPQKST